jgi:3-hydroxyisobutyrate dehydrogenase/2-hydroxy-3-oxopropionate reductase
MTTAPTVGILGCGRMGSAMARALAEAGNRLVVYNRSPKPAAALAAELGAGTAATPAELASRVDVAISMLADGPAVDAVYRGPDGALAGARPGLVLVDSSTVPPAIVRGLEADARAAGAGILDAPVSGSVSLATAGELTLMVGGTAEDLERARPVLEAVAARIFHLGPLGSGAAMKLAVNSIVFSLSASLSEALVLAERAGIDRAAAYDVFAASAIGAPFVQYKRDAYLDPDGTPVAFSFALTAKDLDLIFELAESVGTRMEVAEATAALAAEAAGALGDERDFSTIAAYLRASAPVPVPADDT